MSAWGSMPPEPGGDLLGVELVGFGLAALNCPQVQSVAQDERELFLRTAVGEPVSGEPALAGDGQAIAVEVAEEEKPGVEIDASIESGLGRGLEGAHEGPRFGVMRGEAAGCPLHHRIREPS